MVRKRKLDKAPKIAVLAVVVGLLASIGISSPSTMAITPLPEPDPKPGGFGIEATKSQPAPTQGATITTPGSGSSFATSPIAVSGICPEGLIVQLYNNNVMVGSTMCQNGSFNLQVSLFAGTNDLKAIVYDDLEQSGPESNVVSVQYTDTSFQAFGELITLTTAYGRRSAPTGGQLDWPLQLSGGTGPYAFSIDWGDGSEAQLQSQSLAGLVNINHIYKKAGVYQVNVKVTDTNGVSAFLQIIAVASGQADLSSAQNLNKTGDAAPRVEVLWAPAAIALILLFPAYWLGRQSQLVSLRNKLEKERDAYREQAK